MELRIMCDAFVEIQNAIKISDVEATIKDYYFDDLTLKGNVLITGSYTKYESLDKEYDDTFIFSDEVPFTIVFKNSNYEIENISIKELNYYEVVNQGIKCDFQIVVEYDESKEIELKDESDKIIKEIINDNELDIQNSSITADEIINNKSIDDIKDKYDDLLEEIFATSKRSSIDDKKLTDDIVINVKTETKGVDFSFIKESSGKYRVYYPKQENEIEKVCNLERISVNNVYAENYNKDYSKKRRIIIKK